MLPAIALACLLFPTRFTSTERCSAPQTLLMGATFVTEGALPFALRDPLRVSLACIAGSALAGFITILLGCGCPAPHGGVFLLSGDQIFVTILMPGPMVDAVTQDLMYWPFAAAGLALMIAPMSAL